MNVSKGMLFGLTVMVVSFLSGCTTPVKALSVKELPVRVIESDELNDWPEIPGIDALNAAQLTTEFSNRYSSYNDKIELLRHAKKCSSTLPDLVSAGLLDEGSARMYEHIKPNSIEVYSQESCNLDKNTDSPILTVLSFPSAGNSALSKVTYYREKLQAPIDKYSVVEVKETISSASNVSLNSRIFSVAYSLGKKSEFFIIMTRAEFWNRSINEIKRGELLDGVPFIYSYSQYGASRQINGKLNGIRWSKDQGKTKHYCYLAGRSSPYLGYVLREGEWGCTPVDKSEAGKPGVVEAS